MSYNKTSENKCDVYDLKVARRFSLQLDTFKIKKRWRNARKIMHTRAYGRERRVNEILARLAVLSRYVQLITGVMTQQFEKLRDTQPVRRTEIALQSCRRKRRDGKRVISRRGGCLSPPPPFFSISLPRLDKLRFVK